jgi:hypothetical protein
MWRMINKLIVMVVIPRMHLPSLIDNPCSDPQGIGRDADPSDSTL